MLNKQGKVSSMLLIVKQGGKYYINSYTHKHVRKMHKQIKI